MATRAGHAGRDMPLLLCRVGFVLVLAGVAAGWSGMSADDSFSVIIVALVGTFALG